MKRITIILLMVFGFFGFSQEQNSSEYNNTNLFNVKKPEVSGMMKFGEIPVNLFKGVPNINIPIFNHKGKEISVNIDLSYDASGIKVDQLASWVGLGWNLNVGGVITRDVQGLPDDYNTATPNYLKFSDIGNFICNYDIFEQFTTPDKPSQFLQYKKLQRDGLADWELDSYNYYAGNIKGRIVINYDNNTAFDLENPNYKVNVVFEGGNSRIITGWTIKDENGVNYIFNKIENTQHDFSAYFGTSSLNDAYLDYNSSWYLTRISSANGKEYYDFIYTPSVLYQQKQLNLNYTYVESLDCPYMGLNSEQNIGPHDGIYDSHSYFNNSQHSLYKISDSYIKQINYNSKSLVTFDLSDDFRIDLPGQKRLACIHILNEENNLFMKNYNFIYSYYNNDSMTNSPETTKRNKLDKISVTAGLTLLNDPNTKKLDYEFEYTADYLPRRFTSQDYFGYINGLSTSFDLIPKYEYSKWAPILEGSDRNPNYNSLMGVIKKIKYPTKGYTEFEFEMNGLNDIGFSSDYGFNWDVIASSNGGNDPTNTYNYNNCTDIGITSNNAPVENTTKFYIPESGTYQFFTDTTINYQPNLQNNAPILWFGIYTSSENDECIPVLLPNGNTVQLCPNNFNFCELYNNPSNNILVSNGISSQPPSQFNLYLEQGYYTSLTVSNSANSFVVYRKTENNNYITKGNGLRIKSINNYDSNENFISKKEYYYDDAKLKNIDLSNIPFATTGYSNNPNIKIIEWFRKYNLDNLSVSMNPHVIRRYAQPINTNPFSTIGYENVTEISKDENNNSNGYKVFRFNIESNYELYNSLNYNQNQWEQTNQLQSDVLRGTLLEEKTYSKSGEILTKTTNFYKNNLIPALTTFDMKTITPTLDYSSEIVIKKNNLFSYKKVTEDGYSFLLPNGNLISESQSFCYKEKIEAVNNLSIDELVNCQKGPFPIINFNKKKYFNSYVNLEKTIDSIYFDDKIVVNEKNFNYNKKTLTSQTTTNSTGETLETKYFYPQDNVMAAEPNVGGLIAKNIVGIPLNTQVFKNGEKLSEQVTKYGNFQNMLLPQFIYAGKANVLEKKITYDFYDTSGNLTQYTPESGMPVTIIWGYNKTQPIAKIENATNAQVAAALGVANISSLTEANLPAIDALRNSSNTAIQKAMITTYTHKPLIGVSTITDPKGDVMRYNYDTFGRLQNVTDKNGNKLSENEYHYKP